MWISVLGLAFMIAVHPLRLGATLVVISRPRTVQNLIAYWVGSLIVGFPVLLVPLMVLHGKPILKSFMKDSGTPGAHSGAQYLQIGLGLFSLSIAAMMAIRFALPSRTPVSAPAGNGSPSVLDPTTPTAVSRLLGLGRGAPTDDRSTVRRILGRVHNGWDTGSLWVALGIGFVMAPSPDVVLTVLAIIVPSGAATGTQVGAAVAFLIAMLAVVEVILISYLIAPAKTQAVLRLLHDWAVAQRRKLLVTTFAVIGILLVATGMGAI